MKWKNSLKNRIRNLMMNVVEGAGIMMQWVKSPRGMSTSHIRVPVWALAPQLPNRFLANAAGKAVEVGPNV